MDEAVSEDSVEVATAVVSGLNEVELVGGDEVIMANGVDKTAKVLSWSAVCPMPAITGPVGKRFVIGVICSEVEGSEVVVLIAEVARASDVEATVDCALVASVVDGGDTSVVVVDDGDTSVVVVDGEDTSVVGAAADGSAVTLGTGKEAGGGGSG